VATGLRDVRHLALVWLYGGGRYCSADQEARPGSSLPHVGISRDADPVSANHSVVSGQHDRDSAGAVARGIRPDSYRCADLFLLGAAVPRDILISDTGLTPRVNSSGLNRTTHHSVRSDG